MSGRAWLALLIVYVVWGSTYLAIKWAVVTMPPFTMTGVRFLLAGVVLAAMVQLRRGSDAWRVDGRRAGNAALGGVLMLAGGNGMLPFAETRLPSGLAALLVAVVPLWLILLRAFIGERTPPLTFVGVLAGLGGLVLLLLPGSGGRHVDLPYALLVLAAALSWAIGSLIIARSALPDDPSVTTSIEMLAGGVVMLAVGAGRGEIARVQLGDVTAKSWLSLGYLIVFGSIVALSAYVYALANGPTSLVATYAYVNPVVAVFLGVLLDHEHLSVTELAGGLVILASVGVVVSAEGRHRSRAAAVTLRPGDECAVATS